MVHGRLADPDCSLQTDPRADPRMVVALEQFGIAGNMPVVPLAIDAPLEERLAYAEMCEAGIGAVLDAFAAGVPDTVGVTTSVAGVVSSVNLTQSPPLLSIGGQTFTVNQVQSIID